MAPSPFPNGFSRSQMCPNEHHLASSTGFPWVRRCREAHTMKMEPFWGSFLVVFLILLLLHSKRENAIRISPEVVLGIPKPHFLGSIFDHFLGPFPDPPLEGLFEPSWHAQVPVYTPKVNFGPLLGSPWAPKSTLGAARIVQKVNNGHEFFERWGSRGRPWRALRSKRVPAVIFYVFRTIFNGFGAPGGILIDFTMILDVISMIADGFWAPFRHGKKNDPQPNVPLPSIFLILFWHPL